MKLNTIDIKTPTQLRISNCCPTVWLTSIKDESCDANTMSDAHSHCFPHCFNYDHLLGAHMDDVTHFAF